MRALLILIFCSAPVWAQCGKMVPNPTTGKLDCVGTAITSTTAESNGAAPTASASTNVAAINTALAKTGLVTLDACGTYSINDSLVIKSNTRFRLAPCVTITPANGLNKNLLINQAYSTWGTTFPVTIGSTTTTTVPVAATAHGFSTGDYVLISGASPSNFNGVFQVTVADANDFTYQMDRFTLTAATGTTVAKKCDVNITVEGGVWDGNAANNTSAALGDIAILIAGAQNVTVKNATMQNSGKYLIDLGAVRDYTIENISVPQTPNDVVKINGPAYNGYIHNLRGWANDDAVSLESKVAPAFSAYQFSFGDVIQATVDGVNVNHSIGGNGNETVLYPSTNEYMGGLVFRNIGGTSPSGVCAGIFGAWEASTVNDVQYDNLTCAASAILQTYGTTGGGHTGALSVGSIKLSHFVWNPPAGTPGSTAWVYCPVTSCAINRLTISDFTINNTAFPTAGNYFSIFGGTVNLLEFVRGTMKASSNLSTLVNVNSTGVIGQLTLDGITQEVSNSSMVTLSAGATVGHTTIMNSDLGGAAVYTSLITPSNVSVHNNRFNGVYNGVLRYGTNNMVVNADLGGNVYAGGSLRVVQYGGTGIVAHIFDDDPILGKLDVGTVPTISGCGTVTPQTGGSLSGSFASGLVSCVPVITLPTAPNGWTCRAWDKTTPADSFIQTGDSVSSCTLTGTTVLGDVIPFEARPR